MNFLELVKRLATETGTELESKIDSVVVPPAAAYGETTEHRSRLVRWIREAWIEVQEDQEQWDFMVRRGTMPLVRGQLSYDIASLTAPDCTGCSPGDCDENDAAFDYLVPFVAPLDRRYIWMIDGRSHPVNRNLCYYIPQEFFKGERDRYSDRTSGLPARYTITRSDCIEFDVHPQNDDYNIEFAYKVLPQELLADDDELRGLVNKPKHHMVIVYKAMIYAALFDESDPQFKRATKLYRDRMNKMRRNELGDYSMVGTRS